MDRVSYPGDCFPTFSLLRLQVRRAKGPGLDGVAASRDPMHFPLSSGRLGRAPKPTLQASLGKLSKPCPAPWMRWMGSKPSFSTGAQGGYRFSTPQPPPASPPSRCPRAWWQWWETCQASQSRGADSQDAWGSHSGATYNCPSPSHYPGCLSLPRLLTLFCFTFLFAGVGIPWVQGTGSSS